VVNLMDALRRSIEGAESAKAKRIKVPTTHARLTALRALSRKLTLAGCWDEMFGPLAAE
jgi:hypothetical protein